MFEWFNIKEKPESRNQKIAMAFMALENVLKRIEGYWAVGNKKEGDELLESLVDTCLIRFFGRPSDLPKALQQAQFDGLKQLINFLQKYSELKHLNKFIKKFKEYAKSFEPMELDYILRVIDVTVEEVQSAAGKSEERLVFYVCQQCGKLNLIATAPCIHCGFAAINEHTLRRSLLLNSTIMKTQELLKAASAIAYGYNSTPRKRVEEIFLASDIDLDLAAKEQTRVFNEKLDFFLRVSKENAQNFSGIAKLSIICPLCNEVQSITPNHEIQRCSSCKGEVPTPYFRRCKVQLDFTLGMIVGLVDHQAGVSYTNFIAYFVLILDYALRRDIPPSLDQGQNLIERFATLGTLSCFSGRLKVHIKNGIALIAEKPEANESKDDIKMFEEVIKTLNFLFVMLKSADLKA